MALQIIGRPCNGFIEVWLLHNDNESAHASESSLVILKYELCISGNGGIEGTYTRDPPNNADLR